MPGCFIGIDEELWGGRREMLLWKAESHSGGVTGNDFNIPNRSFVNLCDARAAALDLWISAYMFSMGSSNSREHCHKVQHSGAIIKANGK